MRGEKWHRILGAYIRQHMAELLLFAAFAAIFGIVCYLYRLETEAVLYAAGLCLLLAAVVLAVRFYFYRRRHETYRQILANLPLMTEEMPKPQSLPEADAQQIIRTLERILQISDTGIGIAPEDLPRIFEKGFTGYNGRADKKSTGLGLYLCAQAAKRLSHRIWAASEPGVGTATFLDLNREELQVE